MRSQSRRSSGVSEDDTRIPIPSFAAPRQEPVDLRLGPDVHATGRFVEHEDARITREPFPEDDLLLVPAGQGRDGDGRRIGLDLKGREGTLRRPQPHEPGAGSSAAARDTSRP